MTSHKTSNNFSLNPLDPILEQKPRLNGSITLINGIVSPWEGRCLPVTSPILDQDGCRIVLGCLPDMEVQDAIRALSAAKEAWNNGMGVWPSLTMKARIAAVNELIKQLKAIRQEVIDILTWEICKSKTDAAAEFDRTIIYMEATIADLLQREEKTYDCINEGGVLSRVRRAAIGVVLAMGPYNYPFNETYTTIIPALLMGNTIAMKIPSIGGLAHMLTVNAFASCFPPGVMNFVTGSARSLMGPLMSSGVDVLAFIGGSKAADEVIKQHPKPHRLKLFLSLEGKNIAVVAPDANMDIAIEQCVLGATNYNGQRCTAIKLIFVHRAIETEFVQRFTKKINSLKCGLPWEEGVTITPLPIPNKVRYLNDLITDAQNNGAVIISGGHSKDTGNLFAPTVVAPVHPTMRLWHEEQFGPVIPIAFYDSNSEIIDYIAQSPYGQQAALFTSDPESLGQLIDAMATNVGRININMQCGRSPDILPFSGRKSSALGTLSVSEAINTFSIETVVACKILEANTDLVHASMKHSNFLNPLEK